MRGREASISQKSKGGCEERSIELLLKKYKLPEEREYLAIQKGLSDVQNEEVFLTALECAKLKGHVRLLLNLLLDAAATSSRPQVVTNALRTLEENYENLSTKERERLSDILEDKVFVGKVASDIQLRLADPGYRGIDVETE